VISFAGGFDFRFGSRADIAGWSWHVRFTLENRHRLHVLPVRIRIGGGSLGASFWVVFDSLVVARRAPLALFGLVLSTPLKCAPFQPPTLPTGVR
jgi:hypothetical protein